VNVKNESNPAATLRAADAVGKAIRRAREAQIAGWFDDDDAGASSLSSGGAEPNPRQPKTGRADNAARLDFKNRCEPRASPDTCLSPRRVVALARCGGPNARVCAEIASGC
jgi:hypothetical protein